MGQVALPDYDIVDMNHIPSQRGGYCYGSQIMYVARVKNGER